MRRFGKKRAVLTLKAFGLLSGALGLLALLLDGCNRTAVAAKVSASIVKVVSPTPKSRAPVVAAATGLGKGIELYSWFDLPNDPRSRELSGISWDEKTSTLYGVQDETANIVPLVPDRDLKTWSLGPTVALKMNFPLDLEGIVVTKDGFIVASEAGPHVIDVDRTGKLRRDIPLPAHFAEARNNKSLESLTLSPDARYLFTTSEATLGCDGEMANPKLGSRVRILRIARDTGEYEEHAYTTDPVPHSSGDFGVADLAAISNDELLVLERGWTRDTGNTARVYRVMLSDKRSSCLAAPSLAIDAPTLDKQLVVDLASLNAVGLPAPRQKQESALLDNYEGLAIGPRLPDGRATLLLISDDNGRTDQIARILVLAIN